MNSAEKKAPEPSMDDIISSIRNIISDEPQERASSRQKPEAPLMASAPVVQLDRKSDCTEQVSDAQVAPLVQQPYLPVIEPDPVLDDNSLISPQPPQIQEMVPPAMEPLVETPSIAEAPFPGASIE